MADFFVLRFQKDFGEKGLIGDWTFEKCPGGFLLDGFQFIKADPRWFRCAVCGGKTKSLFIHKKSRRTGCRDCSRVKPAETVESVMREAREAGSEAERQTLYEKANRMALKQRMIRTDDVAALKRLTRALAGV